MSAPLTALLVAALLNPPSGRPPMGALERYRPRVYDVKYEVTINTAIPLGQDDPRMPRDPRLKEVPAFGGTIEVENTPIVMPLIFRGAFSQIDTTSIGAELWLGAWQDQSLRERFRIDEGLPHHVHLAVLPIVRFEGKALRWNVSFRAQSFSSRIDDAAAARVPWPREWPAEVADGLQPQLFVESNDEMFLQTVERITNGRARMVPPYLVAKSLVRYCINEVQVTGNGLDRGRYGVLHGMRMVGARQAALDGRGSSHDLACVCVAMLRAAGIPARPVIGIEERQRRGDPRSREREDLVTWAEFYLPDTGWVPFDPTAMRSKGVRSRDEREAWPEFGNMDDLNERVPLAYHFIPPRAVQSPQRPAVWGWDPRPNGAPSAEQMIDIVLVSRGFGAEDPQ